MRIIYLLGLAILSLTCTRSTPTKPISPMELIDISVAEIHQAFREGRLTSEQLTAFYLDRIQALDQSTGLNAIILVNPQAREQARELDAEFKRTGILRPLHGLPVIVKDNFNTEGLQTTAGSISLKGFIPAEDSYQVAQIKAAGAIVLAKSNMAEWAFTPMHSQSSIAGETRNPYALDHVPAGSSGGTGAAVAANLGAIGLGSDTGNSIRGPSSHCALVGIRSTLGLTSRYGIAPLYLRNDVGGPMCRTVADATRLLEVIAGYDPRDAITVQSQGKIPANYTQYLQADGLRGARIGVLRVLASDIDPEILALFNQAIVDLQKRGATVVDPVVVPGFDTLRQNQWCSEFSSDIADYLQNFTGPGFPKNIKDIIARGGFSALVQSRLEYQRDNPGRRSGLREIPCGDPYTDPLRIAYREAIEKEMDRLQLDALIYPSWNYPPALIGDDSGYRGDNSQVIAPHTGQPAFTIPMGFTRSGTLPAGLQFLGRMFAEPTLIKLTYAYEQGTRHRKAPAGFGTTLPRN